MDLSIGKLEYPHEIAAVFHQYEQSERQQGGSFNAFYELISYTIISTMSYQIYTKPKRSRIRLHTTTTFF
jgi:hypothetical protein